MRWWLWVMLVSVLAGCSATPADTMAYRTQAGANTAEESISHTLEMMLEVKELKPAVEDVQVWVESAGGFIQNLYYSTATRARIICRIPASQRTAFTTQVKTLGELQNETQRAEDLADEMLNVDAELKNLYKLRNRLKALLDHTDKVEDILAIEKEFNRVQARIDYLERTERQQQNRIQYTTYTLNMNEAEREHVLGPLGWVVYGPYWVVKKLFVIQ